MVKLTEKKLTTKNKLARVSWNIVWFLLYRPSPVPFFAWRRFLLRSFGAKITNNRAFPYPSARIWAPWNLIMERDTCLSHHVDCYNVDTVHLHEGVTVSQYSYLCTASHDYTLRNMPLITGPILIHSHAWITSDVFIGPGVTIGEGAVVGARSTVMKDVPPWVVVSGNPAIKIKMRKLID